MSCLNCWLHGYNTHHPPQTTAIRKLSENVLTYGQNFFWTQVIKHHLRIRKWIHHPLSGPFGALCGLIFLRWIHCEAHWNMGLLFPSRLLQNLRPTKDEMMYFWWLSPSSKLDSSTNNTRTSITPRQSQPPTCSTSSLIAAPQKTHQ